MSVLVDTGILLRAFVPADPQCGLIRQSLRRLLRDKEDIVTTSQNVAEFCNVSTRPVMARGGYGLAVPVVEARVRFIERVCRLVTENMDSYRRWKEIVARHVVTGVAVHDARLVAIMVTFHLERILTLNDQDFRRYESEGITIISHNPWQQAHHESFQASDRVAAICFLVQTCAHSGSSGGLKLKLRLWLKKDSGFS